MTNEHDPPVFIPPGEEPDPSALSFASAPQQWHLPPDVWGPIHKIANGSGITIAICDTGINPHPDLMIPMQAKSFISGESPGDGNSHGTHCAGIATGKIGFAPAAKLFNGKCLSNRGSGSSSGIAASIRWAVDLGADIISLSLGSSSPHAETESEIKRAWGLGRVVVAAAGNAGFDGRRNTIGWPARFDDCVCVGAYRSDGSIATFSSGGPQIDVAMPGQAIVSTGYRGGYLVMSGTSMATPALAGLLALVLQINRREGKGRWRSKAEFDVWIKDFVEDRGAAGKDSRFGLGVPLYYKIIQALLEEELRNV